MFNNVQISIDGMVCSACVASVERALERTQGVADVAVNLDNGEAFVAYESDKISVNSLLKAVDEAGFEASIND